MRFLLPVLLLIPTLAVHAQTTRPAGALPLANTTVSIPVNDLRALLERDAGGQPPVDYVFAPATYQVTPSGNVATATAEVEVTVLREGWVMVPLGPAAGVLSVKAEGNPAPLFTRGEQLFALLNNKGAGKAKLQVTVERPIHTEGATRRVDVPLIPSPLVNVKATIGEANLDVGLNGSAVKVESGDNATTATATFQGSQTATITWRARPAQAAGNARTYADGETLVGVERGLLRLNTKLVARIDRAAVKDVRLTIDPRATLTAVNGKDVARWSEENAANGKSLLVQFNGPVDGERELTIAHERDLPDNGAELTIDLPSLDGARRNAGVVAVRAGAGFEVRPGKSTAAERIGVSELPAHLRPAGTQFAYRFGETPASITITVERVKKLPARIVADTMTRVAVDRDVVKYHATVAYDILHAGVDTLRVQLPDGVEQVSATGESVRDTQVITEGNRRTLVVGLKDLARGRYSLSVDYEKRFAETEAAPALALVSHPDAAVDAGYVGIEVRGAYELNPAPGGEGLERVDVKELPEPLWGAARSPLLFGYRYGSPTAAKLALGLTRHEDVEVLVAMADVSEAATTVTPDGKVVTKQMFVVRNNLKQFMTLRMPEGAQLWSAFVDDRPVTPSRNAKGDVLIPLRKSEAVDEHDDQSYRAQREQRRRDRDRLVQHRQQLKKQLQDDHGSAADLKPYDVEIVFVLPSVKLDERGQLKLALPQSDVPTGHLSWAVLLPRTHRIADSTGNLREVEAFTLPFTHFADAHLAKARTDRAQEAQKMQQAMQQLADVSATAAKAKGVLPVRIEIPLTGEAHRFEKFLTVDEAPALTVTYQRKLQ